jgi:hypothetical protein
MTIMRRFIFSLLCVATICAAQADSEHTAGLINGRRWSRMTTDEKFFYLVAIQETISLVGDASKADALLAYQFTYDDYRQEINKVYSAVENSNIPVILVFKFCTAKFKGKLTTSQLEEYIMALRRNANAGDK